MSTFLLIRHGRSEAVDYIPGRTPGVNLSSEGEDQIEKLSGILADIKIDMLISSPIDRTRQTAGIISKHTRLPLQINDAFTEIDFGRWTGMHFKSLEEDPQWKQFNEFRSGTRVPGGELISEVQNRFVNEIEKLRIANPNKTIAIVSHGDPIRAAVCYYTGIPLDFMFRITLSTASITALEIKEYGAKLLCLNHTSSVTIRPDW